VKKLHAITGRNVVLCHPLPPPFLSFLIFHERDFPRHVLATPRTSVSWAFIIIVANVWCIYGLACLASVIVARKNAIMLAVVLCMIPAALCVM
jgi:hypothetical protein